MHAGVLRSTYTMTGKAHPSLHPILMAFGLKPDDYDGESFDSLFDPPRMF